MAKPIAYTGSGMLMIVAQCGRQNDRKTVEPSADIELTSKLSPERCELGYVEAKSVHDFLLEITNASNENWRVDKIDIECACVEVLELPKSVHAKSKTQCKLRFTAPEIVGSYTKTIKITLNGQIFQTRLHARIDAPCRVEPKNLIFTNEEKITEKSFTIYNEGKEQIKILYTTTIPAVCTVKIDTEPIEAGSQKTLTVTLNDTTPKRLISLNIQTNHKKQKKITVPVQVK
jgi:hypothetical protein